MSHAENTVNFKLFALDHFIAPSDILPVLENMGLKVVGEHPFKVHSVSGQTVWIHEFTLKQADGSSIDTDAVGHAVGGNRHRDEPGEK